MKRSRYTPERMTLGKRTGLSTSLKRQRIALHQSTTGSATL